MDIECLEYLKVITKMVLESFEFQKDPTHKKKNHQCWLIMSLGREKSKFYAIEKRWQN
jgi:hypothetical protein